PGRSRADAIRALDIRIQPSPRLPAAVGFADGCLSAARQLASPVVRRHRAGDRRRAAALAAAPRGAGDGGRLRTRIGVLRSGILAVKPLARPARDDQSRDAAPRSAAGLFLRSAVARTDHHGSGQTPPIGSRARARCASLAWRTFPLDCTMAKALDLSTVTLCCVDTANPELALRALRLSSSGIRFARTLFLTDRDYDVPGIEVRVIPPVDSREAYSLFVLKKLGEHVETAHVLLIQWDGYVINSDSWRDEFL